MRKLYILLFLILCVQCRNQSQLSTEQKVEDFEFLYTTLEENYPFFGVAERNLGIDWLSKKEEYLEKIRATPNDSTFFMMLVSILSELSCPHLHLVGLSSHEFMLDIYRQASIEKPKYSKWVEVLEKSEKQSSYWQEIYRSSVGYNEYIESASQTINYSDSLLVKDKIAIMKIKSFLYDNLAKDSIMINTFLEEIHNYRSLIIDIQDNFGGSSNYWKEYIVGRLSDTQITFHRTQVVKDGSLNRYFQPDFFEKGYLALKQNTFFPNTPDEILEGSFYISSFTDTIKTNNPIPFKGDIYVLVNNWVVSASEDFAYFCKVSDWATVAGIRTMGDGNCSEPVLFTLPNSGIVVRHPGLVGLNEDGSLNFETQTTPDIEINAKTSDERLKKLVDLIRNPAI